MAEDSPEPIEATTDPGRARRAPPTIDLEASEVSGETPSAGADAAEPPGPSSQGGSRSALPLTVIAALSGACAAGIVLGVVWLSGWPSEAPAAAPPPAVSSAVVDDLAARIARLESKISTPVAATADPALAARVEALEASLTSLRADLAGQRAQSDKLAAAINDLSSASHDSAAAPDLSAVNERIAVLERAARAQDAAIAQGNAKPADDVPLRRLVAASLLDGMVRAGEPYPAALAAAKSLAPDADALKPLDGFAEKGVPNAAALCRELLALVPKLSPPAPDTATTGSGLVERLQAGAARLVRIERTDAVGNGSGNVVARVTAAALRNEYQEARRELNALPPAERAAAQAWIEKADARDAALAASRQFAAHAMAALARPAQ
jgi:hypothetical protein